MLCTVALKGSHIIYICTVALKGSHCIIYILHKDGKDQRVYKWANGHIIPMSYFLFHKSKLTYINYLLSVHHYHGVLSNKDF